MAYYALEPFGEERADYRAASIVEILANTNRDKKRQPTPYTVEDVKLPTPFSSRRADSNRLLGKVEVLNALFGGRDERKGGK